MKDAMAVKVKIHAKVQKKKKTSDSRVTRIFNIALKSSDARKESLLYHMAKMSR